MPSDRQIKATVEEMTTLTFLTWVEKSKQTTFPNPPSCVCLLHELALFSGYHQTTRRTLCHRAINDLLKQGYCTCGDKHSAPYNGCQVLGEKPNHDTVLRKQCK